MEPVPNSTFPTISTTMYRVSLYKNGVKIPFDPKYEKHGSFDAAIEAIRYLSRITHTKEAHIQIVSGASYDKIIKNTDMNHNTIGISLKKEDVLRILNLKKTAHILPALPTNIIASEAVHTVYFKEKYVVEKKKVKGGFIPKLHYEASAPDYVKKNKDKIKIGNRPIAWLNATVMPEKYSRLRFLINHMQTGLLETIIDSPKIIQTLGFSGRNEFIQYWDSIYNLAGFEYYDNPCVTYFEFTPELKITV